jgi:hypothetical protein
LFVILTLALGIGATTAVFSVVDGVVLRPLPYAQSEHLVRVYGRFDPESGFDFPQFSLSNPEFLDYKAHTRALEDVAAFAPRTITVGGAGAEPERVAAVAVTDNLFPLLRATPAMGRGFSAAENKPGALEVVVLSHDYWKGRFGGDQGIIGRTVTLNGASSGNFSKARSMRPRAMPPIHHGAASSNTATRAATTIFFIMDTPCFPAASAGAL